MNKTAHKHTTRLRSREIRSHIFSDRNRTNLLKNSEQKAITFLVQRIPSWVSSNMMTAFGFFGNLIVSACFIFAAYLNKNFLLLGLLGFMISWFGDSLDGRLAYYRNKPRKFYGFVLDITIDWISIIIIGYGYIVYSEGIWEILGYLLVVLYGWEMIIALMRYKITGNYSIDSGILGPTEARIIISCTMVLEVLLPGSIKYSSLFIVILLFTTNIIDTRKLLKISDDIDQKLKINHK
jgi:phosphatidylglycerophosphate synthase